MNQHEAKRLRGVWGSVVPPGRGVRQSSPALWRARAGGWAAKRRRTGALQAARALIAGPWAYASSWP